MRYSAKVAVLVAATASAAYEVRLRGVMQPVSLSQPLPAPQPLPLHTPEVLRQDDVHGA